MFGIVCLFAFVAYANAGFGSLLVSKFGGGGGGGGWSGGSSYGGGWGGHSGGSSRVVKVFNSCNNSIILWF